MVGSTALLLVGLWGHQLVDQKAGKMVGQWAGWRAGLTVDVWAGLLAVWTVDLMVGQMVVS